MKREGHPFPLLRKRAGRKASGFRNLHTGEVTAGVVTWEEGDKNAELYILDPAGHVLRVRRYRTAQAFYREWEEV